MMPTNNGQLPQRGQDRDESIGISRDHPLVARLFAEFPEIVSAGVDPRYDDLGELASRLSGDGGAWTPDHVKAASAKLLRTLASEMSAAGGVDMPEMLREAGGQGTAFGHALMRALALSGEADETPTAALTRHEIPANVVDVIMNQLRTGAPAYGARGPYPSAGARFGE